MEIIRQGERDAYLSVILAGNQSRIGYESAELSDMQRIAAAYLANVAQDNPGDLKKIQGCIERLLEWCNRKGIYQMTPALWKEYKLFLAKGDRLKEYAPMKGQLIAKHEIACCLMFRHACKQGLASENPIRIPAKQR